MLTPCLFNKKAGQSCQAASTSLTGDITGGVWCSPLTPHVSPLLSTLTFILTGAEGWCLDIEATGPGSEAAVWRGQTSFCTNVHCFLLLLCHLGSLLFGLGV